MSLQSVTSTGVRRAVAEFDQIGQTAFLERYGFGRSLEYFLVVGGRHYDSKAILGAAHGYDMPEEGPLGKDDFSGGLATVHRRLEELGFVVERHPAEDRKAPSASSKRNPSWAEEELILALELYLRFGQLHKQHELVHSLSEELNGLRIHTDRPDAARFRNSNGVSLKLANFSALDPAYPGKGMERGGKLDREIWDEFHGDEDAVAAAAERIRRRHPWREEPSLPLERPAVRRRPIERQNVRTFEVQRFEVTEERHRRETSLVHDFAEHLVSLGHDLSLHDYPRAGTDSPLRCDLFDETTNTLYEAKSNTSRQSLRMAVGQLYDYRRFEPSGVRISVLLPREPSSDLGDFLRSCGVGAVYRVGSEFEFRIV